MRTLFGWTCAVALLLCTGCYSVDHFTGDSKQYDNLYFGPAETASPLQIDNSIWRIYALFGLVAYSENQTHFAGNRLQGVSADQRPMKIAVRTELSFLNGLAAGGANLLLSGLATLVFVPRTTEVKGWTDG